MRSGPARVFGIGELGRRLVAAFVGVVLASIIVAAAIASASTSTDITRLVTNQEAALTRSVAAGAGAAYEAGRWDMGELDPVLEVIRREGGAAEVRDASGRVIAATTGFSRMPANPEATAPVTIDRRTVGSVTVRFDHSGLGAAIGQFEAERWRARLIACAVGVLIAVLVSLVVARRITEPLERVLAAIRARERGDRGARVPQLRTFGVLRELTEGFNAAMDAIDARDRLQRDLVANMAHEVRTPVAVLQAGLEAMYDGVSELSLQNVGSLREESLRLSGMLDDLQRLAAAESAALRLQLVTSDLAEIAAEAASRFSGAFEAGGIECERFLVPVDVKCDRDRMLEVITNLLTNALKFTPWGGRVTISTGSTGIGMPYLQVSDTGVGIAAEDLPLVTQRFFRGRWSEQMAHGTGIGLTIVSELVRAHHGELDIWSEPGNGTRVTITLPTAQGRRAERVRSG